MKDAVLLITMPSRFLNVNNSIYDIQLRYSQLALSLFEDYLKDDFLTDWYDIDAKLIKLFTSFQELCKSNNIHDLDISKIDQESSYVLIQQLHDVFSTFTVKQNYKYILCSIPPMQSMIGLDININSISYLNILFLLYLSSKFKDSKIIVGGYCALSVQQHLKEISLKIPNVVFYLDFVQSKSELLQVLEHNQVTINSLNDCSGTNVVPYKLPINNDDLRYSYKYISNYYDIPLPNIPDKYIHMASFKTFNGCINKCAFCGIPNIKFSRANEQTIYDNILKLVDNGINTIFFKDSTINPTRKIADNLCNWIIKNNLKIQWSNSCNFKNTDADFFKMVYDAGGRLLCFGGESASQKILDYINKGISVDHMEQGLHDSDSAGIINLLNIIIGLPYEDEVTTGETVHFLKRNDAVIDQIGLTCFYLMPYSRFVMNPEKYRLKMHLTEKPKNQTPDIFRPAKKPEEQTVSDMFSGLYSELDRFTDCHYVKEYKTKLYKIVFDLLFPKTICLIQHPIFMLYDIYNDKRKVMEISNKYIRFKDLSNKHSIT